MTQRERMAQYIQERYAAEPEYLWARYPNYAVFRQSASRKWFAVILDVARKSLDLPGDGTADIMDLKCGPVLVGSLLAQEGFRPAYHMSKSSWISVLLDETVPDEQIYPLLELSYDSVAPKRKKGLIPVGVFLRAVLLPRRLQHGQKLGGLGAVGRIISGHTGALYEERGAVQGGICLIYGNHSLAKADRLCYNGKR